MHSGVSATRRSFAERFVKYGLVPYVAFSLACAGLLACRYLSSNFLLDDSWRYAFGKIPTLGLHLGKDVFFTYGPTASWFGPILPERAIPLGGWLVSFFVGVCVIDIIWLNLKKSPNGLLAYILPLMALGYFSNGEPEYFWTAILLLYYPIIARTTDKRASLRILAIFSVWSIFGIFYKFSFGFCFATVTAILLMFSRILSFKEKCTIAAGIAAISLLSFSLLTGTFSVLDFIRYLRIGFEMSSEYSERMIYHQVFAHDQYLWAAAYLAAIFLLALWLWRSQPNRKLALSILVVSGFFFYKHACVRADSHVERLFDKTLPLALFLISNAILDARTVKSRSINTVFVLAIVGTSLPIFGPNWPPVFHYGAQKLIKGPLQLRSLLARPQPWDLTLLEVKKSNKSLFTFLENACRVEELREHAADEKVRVVIYPWSTELGEALPSPCALDISPSLQIYHVGPTSSIAKMENDYLQSSRAPDLILMGAGMIDNRNPVAEYSHLLNTLVSKYELNGQLDDWILLKKKSNHGPSDKQIVCSKKYVNEGNLLFVSTKPRSFFDRFVFRMATLLFKGPELTVSFHCDGGITNNNRTYMKDLQHGVFMSPQDVTYFLAEALGKKEPLVLRNCTTPELRKDPGVRNLPIVPNVQLLDFQYCKLVSSTSSK